MIVQDMYLPHWDWVVRVYYNATAGDADMILSDILDTGANQISYLRAMENLQADKPNTGLTYSNQIQRESIVVIGRTTSPEEFQNTFDHEKGHLARHISQALHINPYGEEAQYLAGAIGELMFPVAQRFLCQSFVN